MPDEKVPAAAKKHEGPKVIPVADVTRDELHGLKKELEKREEELRKREERLIAREERWKSCPMCTARVVYEAAEKEASDAKDYGLDVGAAERLLAEGKHSLDQAAAVAEGIKKRFFESGASYFVSLARHSIEQAKRDSVDTSLADKALENARKALDAKDFAAAEKEARAAERMAGEAVQMHGWAHEDMEVARGLIAEPKSYGVDMSEAEGLYRMAREAFDAKDYRAATEKARSAGEVAKKAVRKHKAQRAVDALAAVKMVLTDAKGFGGDMGQAEKSYLRAKVAFEHEDYERVWEHAKRAEVEAKEAKATAQRRRATDMLNRAAAILADVKAAGSAAAEADRLLQEAKSTHDHGAFEKSREYSREAIRVAISAALTPLVQATAERRRSGADTAAADQLLNDINSSVAKGEFERAWDGMKVLKEMVGASGQTAPQPAPALSPAPQVPPQPQQQGPVWYPAQPTKPCPSCGGTVPSTWQACPRCGRPVP